MYPAKIDTGKIILLEPEIIPHRIVEQSEPHTSWQCRQVMSKSILPGFGTSFQNPGIVTLEHVLKEAHDVIIDGISCSANRQDTGSQIVSVVCQLNQIKTPKHCKRHPPLNSEPLQEYLLCFSSDQDPQY